MTLADAVAILILNIIKRGVKELNNAKIINLTSNAPESKSRGIDGSQYNMLLELIKSC